VYLGPNYAIEQEHKEYINELIIGKVHTSAVEVIHLFLCHKLHIKACYEGVMGSRGITELILT
jgi:hypothetical protein